MARGFRLSSKSNAKLGGRSVGSRISELCGIRRGWLGVPTYATSEWIILVRTQHCSETAQYCVETAQLITRQIDQTSVESQLSLLGEAALPVVVVVVVAGYAPRRPEVTLAQIDDDAFRFR